MGKNHVDRQR